LPQDALHPVATDAVRSLGGNLVHGLRLVGASAVGVDLGRLPPGQVLRRPGGL
jgi:hypothetical protein